LRHHEIRHLPPSEFLTVAEATGMILHIGRLMLVESCRQMAEWQHRFAGTAPDRICVNIASQQLGDDSLAVDVQDALDRSRLAPQQLKLEVTESAFLDDLARVRRIMKSVQRLGVEWSLDDFGTGYSSLSYLHELEANTLKVDRAFVSRIGREASGVVLVKAITSLAHTLGMDVVAEGVETAEQAAALEDIACEYAQGFYFAPPVEADAAAALIAEQPWADGTTGRLSVRRSTKMHRQTDDPNHAGWAGSGLRRPLRAGGHIHNGNAEQG
jgi:EAL domain-containing protein (putative c-di-GMP-specific phosphodiesterase class I)